MPNFTDDPNAAASIRRRKLERQEGELRAVSGHGAGQPAHHMASGDGRHEQGGMNKTAVREFVAPETSVAPGEVLVVTDVGSPAFGQLQCPASPLVGGTLHRRGQRTRFAAVRRCEDPARGDGASLYLATCQQPDGSAATIAAAAAATDRARAAERPAAPGSYRDRRAAGMAGGGLLVTNAGKPAAIRQSLRLSLRTASFCAYFA